MAAHIKYTPETLSSDTTTGFAMNRKTPDMGEKKETKMKEKEETKTMEKKEETKTMEKKEEKIMEEKRRVLVKELAIGSHWECGQCTYQVNEQDGIAHPICPMCGTPRPFSWKCKHCTVVNWKTKKYVCQTCGKNNEELDSTKVPRNMDDTWSCPQCTVIQHPAATGCSTCGMKAEQLLIDPPRFPDSLSRPPTTRGYFPKAYLEQVGSITEIKRSSTSSTLPGHIHSLEVNRKSALRYLASRTGGQSPPPPSSSTSSPLAEEKYYIIKDGQGGWTCPRCGDYKRGTMACWGCGLSEDKFELIYPRPPSPPSERVPPRATEEKK